MSWFDEYKKSLKMIEVEEFLDLLYFRPLAFILVKLVYPTRITPNHLTFISILFGIIGGLFYSQGLPGDLAIGSFFFMIYNIIDCSDGQLARLKKNGTYAGRIIDGAGDYVVTMVVFIGIGIGFANQQDNPTYWWFILILTGISNIVQSLLVDYYRNRFLDYVQQRKSTFEDELEIFRQEFNAIKDKKDKWFDKIIIKLYLGYSAFQEKFISKGNNEKKIIATPSEYYEKNKLAVRFWVLIGPTAQISALMIFAAINRIDLFFWVILIGFNSVAIIMWIVQNRIDKSFKKSSI